MMLCCCASGGGTTSAFPCCRPAPTTIHLTGQGFDTPLTFSVNYPPGVDLDNFPHPVITDAYWSPETTNTSTGGVFRLIIRCQSGALVLGFATFVRVDPVSGNRVYDLGSDFYFYGLTAAGNSCSPFLFSSAIESFGFGFTPVSPPVVISG